MAVEFDQMSFPDDQQWLAMRYVLNELSAEQAAVFEAAMADDVRLCEAVSETVRLCSGVMLACEAERCSAGAVPIAPGGQRQSRFAVISALAALALILVVVFFNRPLSTPTVVAEGLASEADVLVNLFSDEESSETTADSETDLMSEDSLSDLVAPEWLLTAIELDDALKEPGEFPGQTPDDETDVF